MNFFSISFVVFVVIAVWLYWNMERKYRQAVLLIASWTFYLFTGFLNGIILLLVICISYYSAIQISKKNFEGVRSKSITRSIHVALCLLPLLLFKFVLINSVADLIIPAGISFYSLQALGYYCDYASGKRKPEKSLWNYMLFINFFPQILSGPISRADQLLPQLKEEREFSYANGVEGLKLILLGAFKKLALADTLAIEVNRVFNSMDQYSGFSLIVAAVMYSFQIYCDFSGYSDIAIGIAKLFNINLVKNFSTPYLSRSISEFWKNWHISLSSWLRDYVYIPLGGNRHGRIRRYVNLAITFLVSGLWHGSGVCYICWGMMHAGYLIIENLFKSFVVSKHRIASGKVMAGIIRVLQVIYVFCLVTMAWVFFRSNSLKDAIYWYQNIFVGVHSFSVYLSDGLAVFQNKGNILLMLFGLTVYDITNHTGREIVCDRRLSWLNKMMYFALVLLIWYMVPVSKTQEFLYFKY